MPGFTITNEGLRPLRGRAIRVTGWDGTVWDFYFDKPRPPCGCPDNHVHTPVGCLSIGCDCRVTS